MEVNIYDSKQEIAKQFSEYFYQFTKDKERITVALSGGSTPKIVFEELARNYKDRISWDKVHFYWGDERCVPPDHEQSNYKMTSDLLLSNISIPESNIHRIRGENDPSMEALRYAELLEENIPVKNSLPHFDLVILGMGDDGHTASVFPHQIDLWDSEKLCEVAQHPDSGQRRVTLTGKVINNAAKVVFLVTGLTKAEKIREIVREVGNYKNYPAALVRPISEDLSWHLDKEAASKLDK